MKELSIIRRSFRSSSIESYIELIEGGSLDRRLHRGRGRAVLHGHLVTTGLIRSKAIAGKLVALYINYGNFMDARKVFDEMPKSDITSWIVMIGACTRNRYHQESLEIFREMVRERVKPDAFMIPSLVKSITNLLDRESGKMIHSLIFKCSFDSDAFVVSSLIDMYSKLGEIDTARDVFNSLSEKDLVVWNAMISGYVHNRCNETALSLMKEMKVFGIDPDIITWNALIAGFAQIGDKIRVSEILNLMCLDGYEPDVVSWTSIISGLVHNFENEQAFDAFRQMLSNGICPNSATISTLLPACSTIADIRRGKEIHAYSVVTGQEDDVFVTSALLDMYAKCGSLSEAKILFYKTPKKTTVMLNSMIFGYTNHGFSEDAIELFNEMKAKGEKFDHLTFTAVLTACSHAGLTELGEELFLEMKRKYKIEPRLEHYAIMVDLVGRSGKLVEAYEMIKSMPMEADVFVWGSLLGACKIHQNLRLARIASVFLEELEPGSSWIETM